MKRTTLGELKRGSKGTAARRTVRDEMRDNLIRKLKTREALFPGIVGYDDSVIPALINAILSRHNFILLGLRGQAKSRILRSLVAFLDAETPVVEGCEIHDHPLHPICGTCARRLREEGDALPVIFIGREDRYVEKLATPDVTIADMIGDLDPIKAARRGKDLSAHENIHFGLLPRAHRGIFAVNELPDLAPKIQVGLFNIMQEGDVQIKGFPIRLPLDVLLVFTANPEDYTARGKIITPLKDRIGSEIKTHYAQALEEGMSISRQEAWTDRNASAGVDIPDYIREVVEGIAFHGRKDERVDRRSGVSQRLPISCLENVVSNAERRALAHGEKEVVPRISDVYLSIPAITGKLELEYEGELQGADKIARELISKAVMQSFDRRFQEDDLAQIVQWFNLGGEVKVSDQTPAREYYDRVKSIQGLDEVLRKGGISSPKSVERAASWVEFVLEGLYAHRKLSRNEERGFFREAPASEDDIFGKVQERRGGFN